MISLEKLITLGEKLGYKEESLQKFVDTELAREEERRIKDEEREQRAQMREREKEQMIHEQRMKELELETVKANRLLKGQDDEKPAKNVTSAKIPKLPIFQDDKDDLDAYLGRFEKYATAQRWPGDTWAINLSALLTGKALDTYYRLSKEDIDNYDAVRDALLKRFRLNEEGFRTKFYGAKAENGETADQFLTRLQNYLTRWLELTQTNKDFEGLWTLFVREHFINACHKDLQTFMRERNLKDLCAVKETADNYIRAHGGCLSFPTTSKEDKRDDKTISRSSHSAALDDKTCFRCGKRGHIASKCFSSRTFSRTQPQTGNTTSIECFLCGRKGHIARNCSNLNQSNTAAIAQELPDNCDTMRSENVEVDGQSHTCKCTCTSTHPSCFVSQLKEVAPDFDDLNIKMEDGQTYPVCHQRCRQPIPICICHSMPTTKATLNGHEVVALRDSGCSGVVVRSEFVNPDQYTGQNRLCLMIDGTVRKVPVAKVTVCSSYYTGKVEAMVMQTPVYDLIIGNIDGASDAVTAATVVTRSQARKKLQNMKPITVPVKDLEKEEERPDFANEQREDKTLANLWKKATDPSSIPNTTRTTANSLEVKNGILYRVHKSNKGSVWTTTKQVVLPIGKREKCLRLAHEALFGGHMGVQKTLDRILTNFYWPGMQAEVARFCKSCDICQRTVPKGRVPKAPLDQMTSIDVPFKRIAVDLVGPIFPTSDSGNKYILTVVDYATRYPEAVALPSIETTRVAEALLDIYSRVGFPQEVLSDLGTQFTSSLMQEISRLISVKQLNTSPYHPMCNGLVEKFNGTMKQILKRLCAERPKDWDRYLSAVMFAYREVPQESTGFSPFELLYGRDVRGPMDILKECWIKENSSENEEPKISYQYVLDLRDKIERTCELARRELQKSSNRYKVYYDRKSKPRSLTPGNSVLILLPTDRNKLLLQWKGPFKVLDQVAKNNYKIDIKGKAKTFHINMLKEYIHRQNPKEDPQIASMCAVVEDDDQAEESLGNLFPQKSCETYKDVNYCENLPEDKLNELKELVFEFCDVFTDKPGTTTVAEHKIELTTTDPVRNKPYPLPFSTRETVKEEVAKMLEANVIERADSPYASPVVLVKKKDGDIRFCIDFRSLNRVTIFDGEPMPTAEDIFSKLQGDVYFSKFDLSKGFWQIPIRPEDKPKTAFITPTGIYQFKKMPFGLVNATATFNRMMRTAFENIPHADSFVDDLLAHSTSWEEHMHTLKLILCRLREAHLTVKPSKCCLGFRKLDYIGHTIGEGSIKPQSDKTEKILNAPCPKTKKEVRAFIGLVGYYRDFVPHFASIAAPLTDLTKKGSPNVIDFGEGQRRAFETLKKCISQEPVLRLPDFTKTFILQTDASDVGAGAALMQVFDDRKHPIAFFSKKFSAREHAYSTVEKECLAVVWGIHKFKLYLYGVEFILETDHEPLSFIDRAKMTNGRIMRWSLFLQCYRFRINTIKGSANVVADYLSRI